MTTEHDIFEGWDDESWSLAKAEMRRARDKHSFSMERGDHNYRLRVLVEEVGEIAAAIEDVQVAEERATLVHPAHVRELREHMLEEIVQVAATALRWASAEIRARNSDA